MTNDQAERLIRAAERIGTGLLKIAAGVSPPADTSGQAVKVTNQDAIAGRTGERSL